MTKKMDKAQIPGVPSDEITDLCCGHSATGQQLCNNRNSSKTGASPSTLDKSELEAQDAPIFTTAVNASQAGGVEDVELKLAKAHLSMRMRQSVSSVRFRKTAKSY